MQVQALHYQSTGLITIPNFVFLYSFQSPWNTHILWDCMIGDFLDKLFSCNVHNFTCSRPGFLPLLERVLLDFTHMLKASIVRMHLRANLWLQMWDSPLDEKIWCRHICHGEWNSHWWNYTIWLNIITSEMKCTSMELLPNCKVFLLDEADHETIHLRLMKRKWVSKKACWQSVVY